MDLSTPELKACVLVASALFLSSCGGGDSEPVPGGDSNSGTTPTFTLDSFSYSTSAAQTDAGTSGSLGFLTVSSDRADNSNEAYAGAALTITHSLTGAGTYSVLSNTDFAAFNRSNSTAKALTATLTAGTENSPLAETIYTSASASSVSVTVDAAGKYHFTSENPLAFDRGIGFGTGLPNAPTMMSVEMTNLYDID